MERMINKRQVWFLESNNILSNIHCGFRKNRSIIDHLVRLDTFIRDAFVNKEHAVSLFFYLEKSYDTTWKYGILTILSFVIDLKIWTLLRENCSSVYNKFKIGQMKMVLNSQNQKLRGSIFASNVNPMMILVNI